MPTTILYGSENEANTAIGCVPTLHYFDFLSRGRGQVVRLMLIDAGAAFKYIHYAFDEWQEPKTSAIAELNPTRNILLVEISNGKILTRSYAIIRHWARQLGKYDGKTEDEKYWADVICDIAVDWRTLFITAFSSPNKKEDYAKHQQGVRSEYLNAVETHLKGSDLSRRGPIVIGTEITYTDMVLYQLLHDENLIQNGRKGLAEYPRLKQLVDAVEERPNIKTFLESDACLFGLKWL